MALHDLIPMLNVGDTEASLDFYRDALDFNVVSDPAAVKQWRWDMIRSGYTELMLSQTGTPPRVEPIDPHRSSAWTCVFYFCADDVSRLYAQVVARGHRPAAMVDPHYGMREFSQQDADGHILGFGQHAQLAGDARTR